MTTLLPARVGSLPVATLWSRLRFASPDWVAASDNADLPVIARWHDGGVVVALPHPRRPGVARVVETGDRVLDPEEQESDREILPIYPPDSPLTAWLCAIRWLDRVDPQPPSFRVRGATQDIIDAITAWNDLVMATPGFVESRGHVGWVRVWDRPRLIAQSRRVGVVPPGHALVAPCWTIAVTEGAEPTVEHERYAGLLLVTGTTIADGWYWTVAAETPALRDGFLRWLAAVAEITPLERAALFGSSTGDGQLSERDRKLVALYLQGKPYRDIAKELGIPVGTARNAVSTLIKRGVLTPRRSRHRSA